MLFRWQPGGRKVDFFVSWLYPKQVVQNLGSFSIVGGFSPTPFRKICSSKWGFIFPQISGWKIKNVSETYVRQNGETSSPKFRGWTKKNLFKPPSTSSFCGKKNRQQHTGNQTRKRCSPHLAPGQQSTSGCSRPCASQSNYFLTVIFLWP